MHALSKFIVRTAIGARISLGALAEMSPAQLAPTLLHQTSNVFLQTPHAYNTTDSVRGPDGQKIVTSLNYNDLSSARGSFSPHSARDKYKKSVARLTPRGCRS